MGAYDESHDGAYTFTKKQLYIGGIAIVLSSVFVLGFSNGDLACKNPLDFDIGAYREAALANTPPNIIECAGAEAGGSQELCHLPRKKRYGAIGQKGITLWMTGLSGSGKSTIAGALEARLVLEHGKVVQMLDGDNVRTGLNRDLGFSPADRAESARHGDMGLKFLEVYMNVNIDVVQARDPKGLYAKVKAGEITSFTGMSDDAPYEKPLHPDVDLPNNEMTIDESVDMLMGILIDEGVLVGN
ncbi:adenylylsulfate kinase [Aureococcus anophagefferens]|nr:adenylylsulfate kinase [Aureococcus anophagefferens]